MTWRHPLEPVRITSHYGDNSPPRTSPHRGSDYLGPIKEIVRAVNDAEVVDIYYTSCLGWVCAIKIDGSDWVVSYAHLNCNQHGRECPGHNDGTTCMKNLKVGDKVKSGQPVGRQGNSGTCSRGDHLHLVLGKSKRSAVSGKTWDAHKYIQKQIDREKKEATESPVKDEQTKPEVTTPEKPKDLPKSVSEALKVILAWFGK